MKCPKCGYLGFEQVDRCRNCGYEFSLSARPPEPDLSLHDPQRETGDPIEDLSFFQESPSSPTPAAATSPPDLPLFGGPGIDDEPLITRVSPPRPPLAVRRATPEVQRLRVEPRTQSFDLVFEPESPSPAPAALRRQTEQSLSDTPVVEARDGQRGVEDAGLVARFVAGALDLGLMLAVDVVVVYFTMAIAGVGILEFGVLPKAPLLIFLAIQNAGYLVGFTASGQTLGQMALGLRVVTADDAAPLGVVRALTRTLVWTLLALPAGLGFLSAVFASDHRGLHDRLAGTRVVRASA